MHFSQTSLQVPLCCSLILCSGSRRHCIRQCCLTNTSNSLIMKRKLKKKDRSKCTFYQQNVTMAPEMVARYVYTRSGQGWVEIGRSVAISPSSTATMVTLLHLTVFSHFTQSYRLLATILSYSPRVLLHRAPGHIVSHHQMHHSLNICSWWSTPYCRSPTSSAKWHLTQGKSLLVTLPLRRCLCLNANHATPCGYKWLCPFSHPSSSPCPPSEPPPSMPSSRPCLSLP